MAKKRSIVTLGPSKLSLATTGVGSWVPFGPTRADRIYGQAIFSAATAGNVTLQGALTTASTNDWFTVLQRTQAQTAITASTVNKLVARLRLKSTSLSSGTVDMVYGGTTLSRDFLPTDLPGLVAWYDASRITGLSDGAAVAQWDDLSGNGNHLTQEAAGLRPIYKVNIVNGRPVVRFDGVDDYLLSGSLSPAVGQPSTIFVVVVHRNVITADRAYFDSNTPGNRQIVYSLAETVNWFAGTNDATATTVVVDTPYYYGVQFNGASSIIRRNGALIDTANVGTQTLPEVQIGNGNASAHDNPLNGDIAEVTIYNVALSAAQISQVEAYLAAKYGVSI